MEEQAHLYNSTADETEKVVEEAKALADECIKEVLEKPEGKKRKRDDEKVVPKGNEEKKSFFPWMRRGKKKQKTSEETSDESKKWKEDLNFKADALIAKLNEQLPEERKEMLDVWVKKGRPEVISLIRRKVLPARRLGLLSTSISAMMRVHGAKKTDLKDKEAGFKQLYELFDDLCTHIDNGL